MHSISTFYRKAIHTEVTLWQSKYWMKGLKALRRSAPAVREPQAPATDEPVCNKAGERKVPRLYFGVFPCLCLSI